jgi:arabinan endo-1,5-alpha-L-arabinosidase
MRNFPILLYLVIGFWQSAIAQQTTTDTSRRRLQQQAVIDTVRRRFAPPPIGTITPTRETPVHDPVMIKQGNKYYLFCTGSGMQVFSSRDMKNWKREAPVFSKTPGWVARAIPGFRGSNMWAPDITYYNGTYYLYYSVSAFGKNTSCIGLATNKTLDSASADFKWQDNGKVVQSVPGRDLWNAIDPNLVIDDNKTPWLLFGSFWDGMKMVKLNDDLASIAQPEQWYSVARRPRDFNTPDTSAGNAAIEGPFIFKKGKYYYLFISCDYCCRGERSDYKVVVGRSENATGPFLDKNGVDLARNGGSVVVQGDNKEWFGVGHNAAYTFDNKDYIIYHGYDAKDRGRSKLIIQDLKWEDDWPIVVVN